MRLGLIAIFIAALLCACSVKTTKPDLKVELPSSWRNTPLVANLQSRSDKWWTALNDPILNDTVTLALQNNLTVAEAVERRNAARAIEKAAIANQRPQIGFYAGPDSSVRVLPKSILDNEDQSNTLSSYRRSSAYLAGFDLNWELPFFGRGKGVRDSAQANIDISQADVSAAKISLVAEVVRVYEELRAADEKTSLLQDMSEKYKSLDELVSKAKSAGLMSDADQIEARSALNDAESALSDASFLRESAIQRLDVLCGLTSPKAEWLSQASIPWQLAHAGIPPFDIPASLIRGRPDIHRAEAVVLHNAGELGIARADLYPKFGVEGALMLSGSLTKSSKSSSIVQLIAPYVRIPLLDWGLNRDMVNEREAELRESVLAYREAVISAIAETELAIANFNTYDEHLQRMEKESKMLQDSSSRAQDAFKSGYFSNVEVLRAEIKLSQRKLQQIDTKVSWVTAFAGANKAQASMLIESYPDGKNN